MLRRSFSLALFYLSALASAACGTRTDLRVLPLDASSDAPRDATVDTAPPDARPDVLPDILPDLLPDVLVDVRPDVLPDVRPDVPLDVLPDVPLDVLPDVRPDGPILCALPLVSCGGACVDVRTNRAHCGACGNPCAAGESCLGGRCMRSGYSSYTVSQVTLAPVDACALPGSMLVLPNVDDSATTLVMPFAIQFYRSTTSTPWVSSNGVVGFGGTGSGAFSSACGAAASGIMDPALFAFWDDLFTRATGVCAVTLGTAPDRTFAITWRDATFCCDGSSPVHLTFTALLHERTDVLEVVYDMRDDSAVDGGPPNTRIAGDSARLGVQDFAGGAETTYSCRMPADLSRALRYTPVP